MALLVKNSIFVHNGASQQISPSCSMAASSLILGLAGVVAPSQIAQDPSFADSAKRDLHLVSSDPTNLRYLIDKAVDVSATDKNVEHDYYGAARPQGSGYDIGACETAQP